MDWREIFKGSAKTAPILLISVAFYVFRHVLHNRRLIYLHCKSSITFFINVITYFINSINIYVKTYSILYPKSAILLHRGFKDIQIYSQEHQSYYTFQGQWTKEIINYLRISGRSAKIRVG